MKIKYVYDALCGWCYGFAPAMSQFKNKYRDNVHFEVISGGMVTGSRIGPIGEVAPYISWAYKDVENATAVKFGEVFLHQTLKTGTAIFTSVPPAVALSVFKKLRPSESVEFAEALQKAIYFDGIEPEHTHQYGKIAERFGLNGTDFVAAMGEETHKADAENDFKIARDLGVTGFPTVFVEHQNTYYKIASGCVPFDTLENNFLTLKNQLNP